MRESGFSTFFLVSLCIHLAGTAAAFVVSSNIIKLAREEVETTRVKKRPDITMIRLYTEIDLARRETEEEKPENARIVSWKSSKFHMPSDTDPRRKRQARKNTLLQGKTSISGKPHTLSTPHTSETKQRNGFKKKKLSKKGLLHAKKPVPWHPRKTPGTKGNTRTLSRKNSEDNTIPGNNGPISLATTKVEYMEYFQKIQQKIDEAWEYPAEAMMNGDSGNSEINFQLTDDGTVDEALVFSSSGSETLDRESVKAVLGAAPYPPIPPEVGRKRLNIVATFRYSMDFETGN